MKSQFRPKRNLLRGLIVGAGLGLSSLGHALPRGGDLTDGLKAYRTGHYKEASALLIPMAKRGNPKAQVVVADMYRTGSGLSQDKHAAFLWYKRAAKKGMPEAQFRLGLLYLHGEGVTDNEYVALDWLEQAARQGHPQARLLYDRLLYADTDVGIGC